MDKIKSVLEEMFKARSVLDEQYRKGVITYTECFNKETDLLEQAKNDIFDIAIQELHVS